MCNTDQGKIKETKACHFPRAFYCDHIVFLKLPTHFNFEKVSGKAYKVCGNVISNILCAIIQIRAIKETKNCHFPSAICDHISFWNYQSISISKSFLVKHTKFVEMSFLSFCVQYRSGRAINVTKACHFPRALFWDHTHKMN